jgi:MFS family permease
LHGLWSLGTVLGAALGAFGVRSGWSLTTQLASMSIVVLLLVVLPARALLADPEIEPTNSPRGPHFPLSWRIIALGVSAFAAMLCEGAVADWAAVYLRTNVHVPSGHAGLGYAAFAAAMVVVRLVSGRLTSRWGARRLVAALAAGATIGMIGALASADLGGTLIGLALLGFGVGIVMPNAISSVGKLRQANAGRGVAIVSAFGWAGFLVGPPLIGQLAGLLTLPAALVVLPVMTALIVVTTWTAA